MSIVFLKQLIFRSNPPFSRSKESAPSYVLHSHDLENNGHVGSNATSVDDFQPDDRLLEKANAETDFGTPQTPRLNSRIISDATIGLSDGLTVPFALSAGLSALGSAKVVVFGGVAELIAGAISMGLGGYLGARSEADAYKATLLKTRTLVSTTPEAALTLASSVFTSYSIPPALLSPILTHLQNSPPHLTDFLLRFHYQLPQPLPQRAYISALTIAAAYFLGGLIPLLPYFFVAVDEVSKAFCWSVFTMAVALFAFGYAKTGVVRGWRGRGNVKIALRGALQMVIVGGVAAAAAMGLVKAFS